MMETALHDHDIATLAFEGQVLDSRKHNFLQYLDTCQAGLQIDLPRRRAQSRDP